MEDEKKKHDEHGKPDTENPSEHGGPQPSTQDGQNDPPPTDPGVPEGPGKGP